MPNPKVIVNDDTPRAFIPGDPFYDGRGQAEYERSRKIAEGIIKIMRGEAQPYRFARTHDAGGSPRYRADMIDAGRGRLLR